MAVRSNITTTQCIHHVVRRHTRDRVVTKPFRGTSFINNASLLVVMVGDICPSIHKLVSQFHEAEQNTVVTERIEDLEAVSISLSEYVGKLSTAPLQTSETRQAVRARHISKEVSLPFQHTRSGMSKVATG